MGSTCFPLRRDHFRNRDSAWLQSPTTASICTARRSRNELYRQLSARRSEWRERGIRGIYRAGDCLAPRYLADAIFDGHRLAQEFESADPQRPKAIIRERQIWGHGVYPKLGDAVI